MVANLTVTDGSGTTAMATVEIRFRPFIDGGVADQAYTLGVAITELQLPRALGNNKTYSLTPPVPGLTFDAGTRILSGTPTTAGTYELTYTATIDAGSDSLSFRVIVNAAPPAAPAISASTPTLTATVGTPITPITPITISNSGGAVDSYAIMPNLTTNTGLDFDTATGTISGTPTTAATAETYTISATNATDTAIATVAITVNDPAPTVLTMEQAKDLGVPPASTDTTGATITLPTSEAVDTSKADPRDFTLTSTLNGIDTPHTVTAIRAGSIILDVKPAIRAGAVIGVSYNPTRGSITGANTGIELAGFNLLPVANAVTTLNAESLNQAIMPRLTQAMFANTTASIAQRVDAMSSDAAQVPLAATRLTINPIITPAWQPRKGKNRTPSRSIARRGLIISSSRSSRPASPCKVGK